jgi:hypothetical protein
MFGLLRQTLRPPLGLQDCVEHWYDISSLLREPPRKRQPQLEQLATKCRILS